MTLVVDIGINPASMGIQWEFRHWFGLMIKNLGEAPWWQLGSCRDTEQLSRSGPEGFPKGIWGILDVSCENVGLRTENMGGKRKCLEQSNAASIPEMKSGICHLFRGEKCGA